MCVTRVLYPTAEREHDAEREVIPLADLKCFEAGYAAGADEDKLDALTSEVEPTAEVLVEPLDLDDL